MRVPLLIFALAVSVSVMVVGCARTSPPASSRAVRRAMVVTGYCPCGQCCGWHRNWLGEPVYSCGPNKGARKPRGITASGAKAQYGTIAADTSLYPYGTTMYVEGYGYGRVEDCGSQIKGNHIDLFFPSHNCAAAWGKKTLRVTVWLR